MPRKAKPTYQTEKMPFAQAIKNLLSDNGLSQEALAKHLGVTRQTISLYVTGQSTPDIYTLKKISEFFNVSYDYLLNGSSIKTKDIEINEICKKLGLSEKAVQKLVKEKLNGNGLNRTQVKAIDYLIQRINLEDDILPLIYQYIFSDFSILNITTDDFMEMSDEQLGTLLKTAPKDLIFYRMITNGELSMMSTGGEILEDAQLVQIQRMLVRLRKNPKIEDSIIYKNEKKV